MARARRRTRLQVSLFPFLSVLACVIGALTLVITATAIGQIATDAIDIEHYEKLEREIATGRQQLAALTALTDEITELEGQLSAARSDGETLAQEADRARTQLARNAPLRRALQEADARVAALERELEPVNADIDARRREVVEREAARARAPILVRPSGSGYGLEPHFVECRDDGLVLYEGEERRPVHVAAHRIPTSADYRRFLRRVRFRQGASVIFLVRPGGVPVFQSGARLAVMNGVRHGQLPIPRDGTLDFSEMPMSPPAGGLPR